MYASNCGGVSGDDEWMLSQVGDCEDSGSETGEPTAVKFVSDGNECDAPFYSQLICSCWRTRKDTGAEKSKPGKNQATEGDAEKGVTCMYMCMCVSVCVKWLMIL